MKECPQCHGINVQVDFQTKVNHPCDVYIVAYYNCMQRGCGHRWVEEKGNSESKD